jgi:hypothetical protein
MTGAGSAEVAWALESSYATLPGTPTWYQPGIDVEVSQASLDNALTRARQPDDPTPVESREGNLEGAFTVTFTMTDTNFHELVFPDSSNTDLASGGALAPTATWYLKSKTPTSTEERFLTGAAVESVSWSYTQGEDVTVELTVIYGDEDDGTNLSTPGSINQPSVSNSVPFHAADLKLNSTSVSKLDSATLELTGLARFRRGQQRAPVDAITGGIEPSLSFSAVLEDNTYRQLAYGSTTANTPQDSIDKQSGTLDLDNNSGDVAEYTLTNVQLTSYDWSDLVAPDTDITDPVDAHVGDVSVV